MQGSPEGKVKREQKARGGRAKGNRDHFVFISTKWAYSALNGKYKQLLIVFNKPYARAIGQRITLQFTHLQVYQSCCLPLKKRAPKSHLNRSRSLRSSQGIMPYQSYCIQSKCGRWHLKVFIRPAPNLSHKNDLHPQKYCQGGKVMTFLKEKGHQGQFMNCCFLYIHARPNRLF